MNIRNVLEEEIEMEFNELKSMNLGSDEHVETTNNVLKLVDRVIELEKMDADIDNKAESREVEAELKRELMNSEKKDKIVKNGLTLAGIVVPVCVTIWGTLKSLKFEETGTITTLSGKNFFNQIFKR